MDIGYAGAFIGGLFALLSPCSVMLLPAFFAYAFGSASALFARTALFFAGLVTTLIPLGVFSATLGSLVNENRGALIVGAAVIVIAAGAVQLFAIPVPGLTRTERADAATDRTSAVSVFALGMVYAVAGVCAGPILGSVLAVAALSGNAVYGAIMLTLYALGLTVPLLVLAAVWKRLGVRGRRWLRPRTLTIRGWSNSWTMIVSGALTIAIGILLLVSDGTASLGGVIPITFQYRAESWAATTGSSISNALFLGVAVAVAAAVAATVWLVSRRAALRAQALDEVVHVESGPLGD
ncbi:cytochrome c biogenesis CcdA family protein [Salinibacterium sp. SWN1162]|uniref:cytochrome c biogenesis CcdA family protein n=1 Tax=Salinibacterium sp. SWN1162 TaxID=2792053 RepID=UPI0018CCF370|nr:cytochrome c biogenesis CcdA family protein [Salinibacterium sp. SWN1162]MBH0009498.1 cytochrome c biogenesis protein CcdA [Salinibacterium sp. SWN1162]